MTPTWTMDDLWIGARLHMLERLIYVIWCMAWPFQPSSWSTIYPCCHEASSAKPQTVLCKTNTSSEWPVVYSDIYIILINYIIGKKIKPVSGQCQREWQCQKLYLQTTPWKAKGTGDWSLKPDRKLDLGASTQIPRLLQKRQESWKRNCTKTAHSNKRSCDPEVLQKIPQEGQ